MHHRIHADRKYTAEKALRWLHHDPRKDFFRQAMSFINYEKVEGDIVEFGVGVGKSLALLCMMHEEDKKYWRYNDEILSNRKLIGFDAFEGLPSFAEHHPRWDIATFSSNYEIYHPWLTWQEPISEESVTDLFTLVELPLPQLEKGWFDATLPYSRNHISKIALAHIDCDVYESTRTVLWTMEPALQDGSLLLFDDYFCYKAHPRKGEARALHEFSQHFPHWHIIPYHAYSTFGNSFILHDKRITADYV